MDSRTGFYRRRGFSLELYAKKILFMVGMILLLINGIGFFLPLRNAAIYSENNTSFKNDISLREDQLWKNINSHVSDTRSYIELLNASINKGIAHYWKDEGIENTISEYLFMKIIYCGLQVGSIPRFSENTNSVTTRRL